MGSSLSSGPFLSGFRVIGFRGLTQTTKRTQKIDDLREVLYSNLW